MRNRRGLGLAAALAIACTAAAGCVGPDADGTPPTSAGGKKTFVVGVSGALVENQLVAEMYAQVLERAGYHVERQLDLRSREVSQNALESGQIDLKPEYLSSLLLFLDPNAQASPDPANDADQSRRLLKPRGITLLRPSPSQDTNEFVVTSQTARRFNLTTLSSLARVAGQLTLGGPPECAQRPLCIPGLKMVYGIVFDDFDPLDVGGPQTIAALRENAVQVGLLFSTDPSIRQNGFVPLVDDKHLQNAENLTPVIRSEKLNDEVRSLLDAVSARLTTENLTELVGKVEIDGQNLAVVARKFLTEAGLP